YQTRAEGSAARPGLGPARSGSGDAQSRDRAPPTSLRPRPVMGLRAARDDGAAARSDPAGVCLLRTAHPDDRVRLWYLTRCRASALRCFRSRSDAREPNAGRGILVDSALLRGTAAG